MFVIFLVFLLTLGFVGILGLFSVIFSFTNARKHWATLACAIPAFVIGLVLTFGYGLPKPGDIVIAYILTWANLLFGTLGLIRWFWNRTH